MESTISIKNISGYSCLITNKVINGDGFYVSHNNYDIDLYGNETTALVDDNMRFFFVLNGNHMAYYKDVIKNGYEACLKYFKDNIDQINFRSNKQEEIPSS